MGTLQGEAILVFHFANSKRKYLFFWEKKILFVRADPIFEGLESQGKQTGDHKSCSLYKQLLAF